jgi:hypothetical protein
VKASCRAIEWRAAAALLVTVRLDEWVVAEPALKSSPPSALWLEERELAGDTNSAADTPLA